MDLLSEIGPRGDLSAFRLQNRPQFLDDTVSENRTPLSVILSLVGTEATSTPVAGGEQRGCVIAEREDDGARRMIPTIATITTVAAIPTFALLFMLNLRIVFLLFGWRAISCRGGCAGRVSGPFQTRNSC
jgi:hypothetical protein